MPRFLVKRLNGLYAEFSTIVDAFTVYDMTEQEAFEHYRVQMGDDDARGKVRRGIDDEPVFGGPPGSGRDRWDACLRTMRAVNPKALRELRTESPHLFTVPQPA